MQKPSIEFAPEGARPVFTLTTAVIVSALLGWTFLTVILLVGLLLMVNFFRDPSRIIPHGAGLAVAPADGKIVRIEREIDPISNEERTVICTFMNVFNVHVNRSPVDGSVADIRYHPGKFFNASLDKASKHNERNTIVVRDEDDQDWTVVQIAGLLARRIVCHAQVGDIVSRGGRFGMIKLGSRVDVYLPHGYHEAVTLGQHVVAGQTVLAKKV
ncbi:phosphatidylserine decarboxylase family protein [Desulfovibrio inopinatus]|uniref:phosphatidylserine decarboxylase family protein n=1 Tax=Desulfovibrio inopinatus TaxID=102109 RepID=UPI0004209D15|nr:phosphatidylserine decarboxylase family protein [Desulfovibrio inopinatus]